ncbi:MAG: DNA-directed RNA polymerase subunit D [Promethearchaeota archaeon]
MAGKIKIEVLEKDIGKGRPESIKFIVEGVTAKFMNTFRRILLSEIPVMAIEDVIFIENSSPLFDEIIAHRLGLIPLTTDLEHYNMQHECACEGFGCTLCQVDLHLERTVDEETVIYSGEMKSTDPRVVPVSDKIPIVKLERNMSLVFEAYARLGTGKEHAKFQAVATTAYRHYPDLKVDAKKCATCPDQCIVTSWCPKHLFRFDGKSAVLEENWWEECNLCGECQDKCANDAVTVDKVEDKFIMFVESTGALPVKTIIEKGLEIFEAKNNEVLSQSPEALA